MSAGMPLEKNIVWSHSRLKKLFENPAEYFLIYEEGIKPKKEKPALSLGSAVHWLLENGTCDLDEYYKDKGDLLRWNDYTDERCLAEAMAEAFFKRKDSIYRVMLSDSTGKVLPMIAEERELSLTMEVDSAIFSEKHSFLGIIDLLILTEKGWVLVDYKTTSKPVDWDNYKSQLYMYIHLIEKNFPEFPLWKICIINLKKTGIKRRSKENDFSFRDRIRKEYELDEDKLIELHVYDADEFEESVVAENLKNLTGMLDMAQLIINNKAYFINYSNIVSQYGPSSYYDIFYRKPDASAFYTIKDMLFDDEKNDIVSKRNCNDIDMLVLQRNDILNKYSLFKEEMAKLDCAAEGDEDAIVREMKKKWLADEKLLKRYLATYRKGY